MEVSSAGVGYVHRPDAGADNNPAAVGEFRRLSGKRSMEVSSATMGKYQENEEHLGHKRASGPVLQPPPDEHTGRRLSGQRSMEVSSAGMGQYPSNYEERKDAAR